MNTKKGLVVTMGEELRWVGEIGEGNEEAQNLKKERKKTAASHIEIHWS